MAHTITFPFSSPSGLALACVFIFAKRAQACLDPHARQCVPVRASTCICECECMYSVGPRYGPERASSSSVCTGHASGS